MPTDPPTPSPPAEGTGRKARARAAVKRSSQTLGVLARPIAGMDASLVLAALAKVFDEEKLTERESRELRKYERETERLLRPRILQAVSQSEYVELSGRAPKVLRDQARRYGFAFGEKTIDLSRVLTRLHDFIAETSRRGAPVRAADDDEDPDLGPGESPAMERLRQERYLSARLDRMAKEGTLVPREETREILVEIASALRRAGDRLTRSHGHDARALLDGALDEVERLIDRRLGDQATQERE